MESNFMQYPKWYAVYTCPNIEKKICNELAKRKIQAFLPTRMVMRQWSDRKKIIEVPLFPNYLFVNIHYKEMWLVLMLAGVVRFVSFGGIPVVVKDAEIDLIKRLISGAEVTDVKRGEGSFNGGERVQIKKGPLTGLVGTVANTAGITRLHVELETIQQVISINIDAALLEKVS